MSPQMFCAPPPRNSGHCAPHVISILVQALARIPFTVSDIDNIVPLKDIAYLLF